MVKNTDNFIMLLTGELYTDLMEIHMLELRKLPSEAQNEKGIIHWGVRGYGKTGRIYRRSL